MSGAEPPIPEDVARRLLVLAWLPHSLDRVAETLAPYVPAREARAIVEAWLPRSLVIGDPIPTRLPNGQPLPPTDTPWPRELSPVPGVDFDTDAVVEMALVVLESWAAGTDDESVDFGEDRLLRLLGMWFPRPLLRALGASWVRSGNAGACVRAALPRDGAPGWLERDEITRLLTIVHDYDRPIAARRTDVFRLLVRAGAEPRDAWAGIAGWSITSTVLPNGQWLPKDIVEAARADATVFAGLAVPSALVGRAHEARRQADAGAPLAEIHARARRIMDVATALRAALGCAREQAHAAATALEGGEQDARRAAVEGMAKSAARAAIDAAIAGVLLDRPLHWAVLASARIVEDPTHPTMAVGLTELGELVLFFNPGFTLSISHDERRGVLVHEIAHVIFGHVAGQVPQVGKARAAGSREHARDVVAWRWACECTANEYVPYPLPGKPITIELLGLPPDESTLDRYKRLRKKVKLIDALEVGVCAGEKCEGGLIASTLARDPAHHQDRKEILAAAPGELVARAAELIEGGLDAGTRRGLLAVGDTQLLRRLMGRTAQLKWNVLLRMITGSMLKRLVTRTYPSRRRPELVGIVPGRRSRRERPAVLIAIDTSASMSTRQLEEISVEVHALQRQRVKVACVQCDVEIQEHGWLRVGQRIERAYGRGGTDLRPPFGRRMLERYRPDLIVYFTDGGGPAPRSAPPGAHVLWILLGKGAVAPASFGRVVRM